MQILIALFSNVLETITVVVFGGPWGFYHIMVEVQVYGACAQTRGKMSLLSTSLRSCRVHHPSDKFICETLVCIPDLHHIPSSFILNAL